MTRIGCVLAWASGLGLLAACGEHPPSAPAAERGGRPVVVEPLVGEVLATLTSPPAVPPPIKREYATKMIVKLEVREVVQRLADGVDYTFWTFGGTVPGKFIRIREGDVVEFHLSNHPDSKMPHNIDLHAVTGPGGGAAASFTAPGHTSQFTFKAINPGLFIYHCATAPVGMHIGNGMYGLILVEPRGGLPPVDREYYVVQGEFYTVGDNGQPGLQPFSMEKALREDADYVVFNGAVGALAEERAMTARVGETVRLFVGNGGPNLLSSFHVIGEIFDVVYAEGGDATTRNVQTTLIPAGGSAIVDFKCEVPGSYILVDHSIFRAFNKGALAVLKVEGAENTSIYSGRQDDRVYQPEGGVAQAVDANLVPLELPADLPKEKRMEYGERLFVQICAACHQKDGHGLPNLFPPLAKSDFLMADKKRSITALIKGLQGKITVNGKDWNGVMPALALNDHQIANVLTYVRNSWGNEGEMVTAAEVKAAR